MITCLYNQNTEFANAVSLELFQAPQGISIQLQPLDGDSQFYGRGRFVYVLAAGSGTVNELKFAGSGECGLC